MRHDVTNQTFKTGPVDPTKPMELDDGTSVEPVSYTEKKVKVRFGPKDPERGGSFSYEGADWNYDRGTGVFNGGSAEEFYVLRNVALAANSLPDDAELRNSYLMFDGLLAYFPNALAEVSRVSKVGNDQHNPGQPLHWARGKSTDHGNKIMRHLVDAGGKDGDGIRHTARLAWRALAMLQEELERDEGYPVSRGSKPAA